MKTVLLLLSGILLLASCGNNASTEAPPCDSAIAKTDAVVPKVDTVAVQVSMNLIRDFALCRLPGN
jgi:hypothetical protein